MPSHLPSMLTFAVFLAAGISPVAAQGVAARQADGDAARCGLVLDLMAQDKIEDAAKAATGGPGDLTATVQGLRRIMDAVHSRAHGAPMTARRKLDDATLPDGKTIAMQSWEFSGIAGTAGCARFEVGNQWRLEFALNDNRDAMMNDLQARVRAQERAMGVIESAITPTAPPVEGGPAKSPLPAGAGPSAGGKPPPADGASRQ